MCTTELGEAAIQTPAFTQRGVKLMAISCDSVEDHTGWCTDICANSGVAVTFPIISDPTRETAVLLGMLDEDEKDGAGIPATVRKLFIIGPDRKTKLVLIYPTSVGRNFVEVLRVIDALQLAAKFPIATPANWVAGGDVMIQPSVSDADAEVSDDDARLCVPWPPGHPRTPPPPLHPSGQVPRLQEDRRALRKGLPAQDDGTPVSLN